MWSNLLANLVWIPLAALGALALWLMRDLLGARAAAWWHGHISAHSSGELARLEQRISELLAGHHAEMKAHVPEQVQAAQAAGKDGQ